MQRKATAFLIVLALVCCKGRGGKDTQYKTEKVDRGTVTTTVTATGTLSAVTTVQVGSQVSGVIARLYADFNSKVTKGQLLAELDPTPFEAQVAQRRADLTQAQVQADDTRIKYDRQRRLLAAGLAAQADVDGAEAQYKSARAQTAQAQAALSQVLTNLRYTKINSPIDGIVVDRQYNVGQTVAASFQAPTLFEIAQDLTKMQVQADVDQSDIGRIKVGQIARFNVDAYPEDEFRGRIAQIRYNAQVNQNVVTYPVILEALESGRTPAPEDDRERQHRHGHGAERPAHSERRVALQAADGRRRVEIRDRNFRQRRCHAAHGTRGRRRARRRGRQSSGRRTPRARRTEAVDGLRPR